MKRCLTIFLTLSLLLAALFAPAQAEGAYVAASTPLGDSAARVSNIRLAAGAINGVFVPYGGSFSFNGAVGARTAERGYQSAVNGRGVRVVGGGVAQAASTLYLALKQVDGIVYDEKKTYGSRYSQNYVESSDDAILVDEAAGTDFAFTNFHGDMTIAMYISGGEVICTLNFGGVSAGAVLGEASVRVEGAQALLSNISLAAQAINGTVLVSGDTFSFNALVGARTAERGYQRAVNGRGVEVTGGGVAQVASAVWLAVKGMADVAIVEKSTYGNRYSQNYVSSSADAILVDYNAGTDFSFRYTGAGSVTIQTYLSGDTLVCRVTGGAGADDVPTFSDDPVWW